MALHVKNERSRWSANLVYVRDMTCHDIISVFLFSKDTDVAVLAIYFFHSLKFFELKELCILYISCRNQIYLPIHHIAEKNTRRKFHYPVDFTRLVVVIQSQPFSNKGKFSTWKTWNAYEKVTRAFIAICSPLPAFHPGVGQLL